jgi:hypothetical protein
LEILSVLGVVKALPSVQPPPIPLNATTPLIVVPFVVTVFPVVVALNVIVPVVGQRVPAISDIDPLIANVGVVPSANVTVPADTVISRQVNAPVQVTV